jgi:glyoxylase-like metal-dependent hydrolase (beta-lactamase superfamily II)
MALSFPTQIFPVYFNSFMVPGAAMVVSPGKEWRKLYPAVNTDFSKWVLRSLIVVKGGSVILFDAGFGNKQPDTFFDDFHLEGDYKLDSQLSEIGLSTNDITDVVLTHLHYDHCGGCLLREDGKIVRAFPKAKLWISSAQWEAAKNPTEEEKESFLDENIFPLTDHYPVQFVEEGGYLPGIYFKIANGHTKGQIIPLIKLEEGSLLFGADLFPSSAHLDPEVNMAYDTDRAVAKKEKQLILDECIRNNYVIAFQHGLFIEAGKVSRLKSQIEVQPVKLETLR